MILNLTVYEYNLELRHLGTVGFKVRFRNVINDVLHEHLYPHSFQPLRLETGYLPRWPVIFSKNDVSGNLNGMKEISPLSNQYPSGIDGNHCSLLIQIRRAHWPLYKSSGGAVCISPSHSLQSFPHFYAKILVLSLSLPWNLWHFLRERFQPRNFESTSHIG